MIQAIRESSVSQKIIYERDEFAGKRQRFDKPAEVIVSKKRTFEAALGYENMSVAVLNFASAKHAGGGVESGSFAQEECLCRCSTLYFNLKDEKMRDGFYSPHWKENNPLHNDDIIYTPGVVVLKSDDDYHLLADRQKVNIITCAAPNLRKHRNNGHDAARRNELVNISDRDLTALHEKRAARILDVASFYENDVIVLGAFGCGAFKNNPEAVARAYKKVIADFAYAFKKIEFAIYCPSRDVGSKNFEAFNSVLS